MDTIKAILETFPDLTYFGLLDTTIKGYTKTKFVSNKAIYICQNGTTGEFLKVGQSCNWTSRVVCYKGRDGVDNLHLHLFDTPSWIRQDELEQEVTLFLISRGHELPWDNTTWKNVIKNNKKRSKVYKRCASKIL